MQTKKQQAVTWAAVAMAGVSLLGEVIDRVWPPYEAAAKTAEETRDVVRTMYQDMLAPKLEGMSAALSDVRQRTFRLEGMFMSEHPRPDEEEEAYEEFAAIEVAEKPPAPTTERRAPKKPASWAEELPTFEQVQEQAQLAE